VVKEKKTNEKEKENQGMDDILRMEKRRENGQSGRDSLKRFVRDDFLVDVDQMARNDAIPTDAERSQR